MAYLSIIVTIVTLFMLMHKFTELGMRQKVSITLILSLVIVILFIFEQTNTQKAKQLQELRYAFNQGKTLICDGKDVNNSRYSYVSRSLVGKKGTDAFGSPNLPLSHCKIRP